MIYVGGGVTSHQCLRQNCCSSPKPIQAPVTTTLMGMASFPKRHPLSLGMLGMHGTYYANMAVTNCDLLIAIGARFDDRVTGKISTFAPHAKIIHIDIDPTSIKKNVRVDLPIVGDLRDVLEKLVLDLGNHAEAVKQLADGSRSLAAGDRRLEDQTSNGLSGVRQHHQAAVRH